LNLIFRHRQYRLVFLDEDGSVESERQFHAEDDGSAVQLAASWLNGRAAELWSTHQRITRW